MPLADRLQHDVSTTLSGSDILVFRSAHPGKSFETWLFQKVPPGQRRSLAAAIAACAPHWRPGAMVPGGIARRAPALYEAKVRVGRPSAAQAGRLTTVSVFFLWTDAGPILLSAGEGRVDESGEIWNLALGDAHQRLRELRAAEEEGSVARRLGVHTFEEIKHQCRVGRTIAWDKERLSGLIDFRDIMGLLRQEAEATGRHHVRELETETNRRAIGVDVLRLRRERGITQTELAQRAGVLQPVVSEIEHGLGNPTLATVAAIVIALGRKLVVG